MAALEQEQLRVVLLDTKHRILGTRTVYQGSVNQAQVRVDEALRDTHTGSSSSTRMAAVEVMLNTTLPLTATSSEGATF